ncbi:MAG: hypothetical protein Q4C89_07410 [Deinococcus sp.]|uniref:hypothetical protein n=1 Tax=Deinococcus sp. TaxID=47478 RepID=UPI0026DABD52|nr:hypothetical protein [Deinococcus sp.]MDO4245831.1 hypothetical protein [Deinococcus sp.]
MRKNAIAFAVGLCGLLWQSAQAQGLPKVSDIVDDSISLRNEVKDLNDRVFYAIQTGKYVELTEQCSSMESKRDSYMKSFLSNKAYNYFSNNRPKSYKEQYLYSALISLKEGMQYRIQAVYFICKTDGVERTVLASAMGQLSAAYNAGHNAELWAELADMQK